MRTFARQLLLLLGLLLLAGCSGRWEEKTVDNGYKGEARRNRLLAAQRLVRTLGGRVEDRRTLGRFQDEEMTAMMIEGEAVSVERTARHALQWVQNGGHLIFVLRYAPSEITGLTAEDKAAREGIRTVFRLLDRPDKNAFLKMMGVSIRPSPVQGDFTLFQKPIHLATPVPPQGFQLDAGRSSRDLAHNGDASKPPEQQIVSVLSLAEGEGRVTFLSDNLCWRNDQIGRADHARFLGEMLRLTTVPTFIFVRESEGSFFALLWAYGWLPLVAGLAWLVFWLWKITRRFGPPTALRDEKERQFARHLRQAGTLLWRHGHADQLLDTQRERIRRELARKEFQGQEPRQLSILCSTLARRTGVPEAEVSQAMSGDNDGPFLSRKNPRTYLELFRSLQRLEQLL